MYVLQAREAGIDLQLVSSIPPQPVLHLFADQGKVAQVVRNLLSNALKFTNRNGTVHVALSVEEEAHVPDVEKALPTGKWTRFLKSLSTPARSSFLRSPKTYCESFLVSKYLVIDVVDSGVGISLVKLTLPIDLDLIVDVGSAESLRRNS